MVQEATASTQHSHQGQRLVLLARVKALHTFDLNHLGRAEDSSSASSTTKIGWEELNCILREDDTAF